SQRHWHGYRSTDSWVLPVDGQRLHPGPETSVGWTTLVREVDASSEGFGRACALHGVLGQRRIGVPSRVRSRQRVGGHWGDRTARTPVAPSAVVDTESPGRGF